MPELIKERRVVDDNWKVVHVAEGTPSVDVCLPHGPLLVPLAVWQAHKRCLIAREWEHGTPLGLWLAPEDDPAQIATEVEDFSVIAIHFPKTADGRGYSTARVLRERYGYSGELRAFGDIGRDQIFFLHRVGFDAFQLGEGRDAAEALAAFDSFSVRYQGAADEALPLFRRRA